MAIFPAPLHAAVVHFPIVLTFAALLLEALARTRRWGSQDGAAMILVVLAALGSVAAVVTGKLAHEEAVVPEAARQLLELHDNLGVLAMIVLLLLAGGRVALARGNLHHGPIGWVYLAALVLTAALFGYQGYLGGRLVYEHGVGTAPTFSAPASSAPAFDEFLLPGQGVLGSSPGGGAGWRRAN